MIRKFIIANLVLLALIQATIVVNAWRVGGGVWAQTILGVLQVIATNPTLGSDANDRRAVDFNCTTDSGNSNTGFVDQNCGQVVLNASQGQNVYGSGTNAKTTFIPWAVTANMTAAGQRFINTWTQNCYGMGDCFRDSGTVIYAGADISGDEGQGIQSVSYLEQQGNLVKTTLSAPPVKTLCNTTITQSVTGGPNAQTVTVANTTNCSVNDWVILDQEIASGQGSPNNEAVQITAVGLGNITGVFKNNHSSSAAVTPALVLTVASASQFGQQRVLVNLSGSSYSTGTVATISGGGLTGSDTSWATNMVGGGSTNIGCLAMTADDYTGSPFSTGSGALKSWYQISSVGSTTGLGIFSFSVAGDTAYHGKGPGSGGYIVRPCVEVIQVIGNQVIAESTGTTWTNGDTVELAISPYADVSGYQYQVAGYSPGGVRREFMNVVNTGAREFSGGISFSGALQTGSNADTTAWGVAFQSSQEAIALQSYDATTAAIALGSQGTTNTSDAGGKIYWNGPYIAPNTANLGMDWSPIMTGTGLLSFTSYAVGGGFGGSLSEMKWTGMLGTAPSAFASLPTCTSAIEGQEVSITNSNTATWGATITTTGSNHVLARCNGTNWTVAGAWLLERDLDPASNDNSPVGLRKAV